ncbi:thioredoxin fold domain-containing protein [Flavobacterium sp.]|uniref:thioredoxin family protein n=1 Tax=Flavobacterium sp. TaxID=239 RepID=UPI00262D6CDA|nr:thioredoxin fold domain-containing protein [Flavobacterium sp.]
MRLFYKIASAFMLLACSSIASTVQAQSTDESWTLVKKQAVSEHKLIFVDLYFTGCAPCAQMDREVFPDTKVKSLLDTNFITFKSDILKEEIGKKLSMKYGVTGFPTFLFLNSDGRVIEIASGFQTVDQFTALLQNAKEDAQKGNFKKYSPQIQEQDYPEFYKKAYLENKRNVSFEVIDTYLKSQPSLSSEIPFVIITGLRVGREYDDFFLKNLALLSKDFGKSSVNNHSITLLNRKKAILGKTNDFAAFQKLLKDVQPFFSTEEWTKHEGYLVKDFGVSPVSNN